MNIPKGIEKLIDKRAKLAKQLMCADSELSEWIEKNSITVEEYDYKTGCEMYCNPDESADRIRQAILDK